MAVINENVSDSTLREHWVELAYIRGASGREITTAVGNIEPAAVPPVAPAAPGTGRGASPGSPAGRMSRASVPRRAGATD